jgi:hypothetical protein
MSEGFKARDIGLRAQKKILSRMASKNVAKVFIDDTTASLLDNVYKLAKAYVSVVYENNGQSSWLLTQRSRVRFPALPDFLHSRGSGTGSTQPHEDK